MLTDKLSTFIYQGALNTGAAGSYLLGSQIDLQVPRDIGNVAITPYLVIQVNTAVDSAGNGATVQFKLASDDSAAVSTTTSTVHLITPVFTQAQMAAGFLWKGGIPMEGVNLYERYLGLIQTTAVEAVTAGSITATITFDKGGWKAYPEADS